jgi:hypothetical protein
VGGGHLLPFIGGGRGLSLSVSAGCLWVGGQHHLSWGGGSLFLGGA